MNAVYNNDYYVLNIYIDSNIIDNINTINEYTEKIKEIQSKFEALRDIESGEIIEFDAGFDLFIPSYKSINPKSLGNKINHGIICSMTFKDKPTAYYLYPRSSMGFKTPLRLSNSVGIIDSGYRGYIIGLVDNNSEQIYNININDRLMQICGPNITYPIYPNIVNSKLELGNTVRGTYGFGSTGK